MLLNRCGSSIHLNIPLPRALRVPKFRNPRRDSENPDMHRATVYARGIWLSAILSAQVTSRPTTHVNSTAIKLTIESQKINVKHAHRQSTIDQNWGMYSFREGLNTAKLCWHDWCQESGGGHKPSSRVPPRILNRYTMSVVQPAR